MRKATLFFAALLVHLVSYSQNQITGTVVDDKNIPLPGASIIIPELQKGTVTNNKGKFLFQNLPKGNLTIEFSYLGFHNVIKKVNVDEQINPLEIILYPNVILAQEIVVSSSSYTSQHENAIKIESIDIHRISHSGKSNLMKSISEVPGIDAITKGNGIAKPVIRGLSNSNIIVLNNGVKLENYQFSENHPFVVNELGIDKVEIIKGPASLLYGSDAIGGLINIIPEKPASINEVIGIIQSKYYSNTMGVENQLGIKGSGKILNWRINAGQKSHKDYKDGNDSIIFNSRFNEQSLSANTGLNTKSGSYQLFYIYNAMKPGMTNPASLSLVNENSRKNEVWYQDLTNHIVSSKNKMFVGRYKLGANFAWQHNDRKLNTDEENEVNMNLDVFSYDLKAWLPANENTEYIVGMQGAYKDNKNDNGHTKVLPDYTQNDIALIGWLKHTHQSNISMQTGVRLDYRNINVPEQEKAGHSHEEEEHEEEEGEHMEELIREYLDFSFSLGGTWQISEEFLSRFNLASAYRTPNVAELTQEGVHGARYEVGNRDLNSQRSYEADLSIHYHSSSVMFDIAGFYNYISGYIFLSPTDEYEEELRTYQYMQEIAALYGWEATMHFLICNWMNADVGYSFVRGEKRDGEYLPFIPQDKLNANLKLEKKELGFLERNWINIGVTYAFSQNHPSEFETSTDAYLLLNAGIGTQVKIQNQYLQFSIIGNNLLDETYYEHLSTLKELNLYNMGRNITFNLIIPIGIRK